ncbi:nucleotidyltransferase domain-containing protein [Candidatus Bipolaricaulota bacterium]
MVERARELIKPYLDREGVIGVYLVGSATRPHRDEQSDLDIEVIVEDDVYERTPDEERQTFVFKEGTAEGEPKVVDYEFYLIPWSDFVALSESTHDVFHYPYQHAIVLHDPGNRITPVIEEHAHLSEDVRQERMTVHYLDFLYRLGRARKTRARDARRLNLTLLYADAVRALVKLLFLVKASWPATAHWSEQELRLLGVPDALIEGASRLGPDMAPEDVKALVEGVRTFMEANGLTIHKEHDAIQPWLFFTRDGKAAFERWGAR